MFWVHILVQCDSLYLQEAGADGLDGAEPGAKGVVERIHLASCYHPLQLCHTERADLVVHIVEALAPDALQDKMAVQAHLLTEAVASERAVLPFLAMFLHPVVDALEAVQVGLVEVILLFLLAFLDWNFGYLADEGAWQLERYRLQRAEHEIEVQYGEENNIDGE